MSMRKSVIKDLVYRVEGFGDKPEYEIRSIARVGGRIIINIIDEEACYEPQEARAETRPEAAADGQAQDGGQTEQEAAE